MFSTASQATLMPACGLMPACDMPESKGSCCDCLRFLVTHKELMQLLQCLLFVTSMLVPKQIVRALIWPYSQVLLQSECSAWCPGVLSFHQACSYIKCPYKYKLLCSLYRRCGSSSQLKHTAAAAAASAALPTSATKLTSQLRVHGHGVK